MYTFLLQNTITNQVYTWLLEDLNENSIYHKFEIALYPDMDDAEYEFILFKNPDKLELVVDVNNIFNSYYIGAETEIETFGLVKIGDKRCKTRYSPERVYVTYTRY